MVRADNERSSEKRVLLEGLYLSIKRSIVQFLKLKAADIYTNRLTVQLATLSMPVTTEGVLEGSE